MIKLSDRLMKIAGLIKPGETMADIGTDHAYLPLFLLQNDIVKKAIATDVSGGSLNKAAINSSQEGFDEILVTRLGDGLQPIENGEVDTVVMAGMGGLLISEILDWDLNKSRSFKRLILHPTNNGGRLRFYLKNKGFDIKSESIVREKNKFAEIIEAVPSSGNRSLLTHKMLKEMKGDFTKYDYPYSILSSDKEIVLDYLNQKIGEEEGVINSILRNIAEKEDIDQRIDDLLVDEGSLNSAYQFRKKRIDRLKSLLEKAEEL